MQILIRKVTLVGMHNFSADITDASLSREVTLVSSTDISMLSYGGRSSVFQKFILFDWVKAVTTFYYESSFTG